MNQEKSFIFYLVNTISYTLKSNSLTGHKEQTQFSIFLDHSRFDACHGGSPAVPCDCDCDCDTVRSVRTCLHTVQIVLFYMYLARTNDTLALQCLIECRLPIIHTKVTWNLPDWNCIYSYYYIDSQGKCFHGPLDKWEKNSDLHWLSSDRQWFSRCVGRNLPMYAGRLNFWVTNRAGRSSK